MAATKIKKSKDNFLFNVFVYGFLILALIVVLYPLYFVLIASVSDPYMVLRGDVTWLPKGITFDSYKKIFANADIWIGYANSIKYTVIGTFLSVTLTVCLAYPLSRKYFCLRKPISLIVLITMYFSGGMVPTYILVSKLGLRNTIWSIILVGVVSAYNVIIARTFFESNIPTELEEAAEIDGCNSLQRLIYIVVPIVKPSIVSVALFQFMWSSNDFQGPLIYINTVTKYPASLGLRLIADSETGFEWNKILALSVISIIPTLIVFFLAQDQFIDGIAAGGVKG